MDQYANVNSVRLSGKIIAQYSRTSSTQHEDLNQKEQKDELQTPQKACSLDFQNQKEQKNEKRELQTPQTAPSSVCSSVKASQQRKQIQQYTTRCILLEIIDHSRKLSLDHYNHELNYTRIRGYNYYYLARHKLLFIYRQEDVNLSILGIENILFKTVKLYEEKAMQHFKKLKLPNQLTGRQLMELLSLEQKINQIIEEEDDFEFVRKESIRDSAITQEDCLGQLQRRQQKFKKILKWQTDNQSKNVKLAYEIQKKVNIYRIKLCVLCLITAILAFLGFYFIYTSDFYATL